MEMIGSIDCLTNLDPSDLEETVCFPLKCWQSIRLSDIWIPSHLFENNKSSNSQQVNQGVFHTLQKEGSARQTESFSVYCDSNEEEEDDSNIFQSDSDDELLFSSDSNISENNRSSSKQQLGESSNHNISSIEPCELKISNENNLHQNDRIGRKDETNKTSMNDLSSEAATAMSDGCYLEENNCNSSENDQIVKAEKVSNSQTSLHEMLDLTQDIDIRNFSFNYKKKDNLEFSNTCDKKKEQNSKRNSKKERQLMKKAAKVIPLGELLDNEVYEDNSDDFYNHVMLQKSLETRGIPFENKREFPSLVTDEIMFNKSDKSQLENTSEARLDSFVDILASSDSKRNQNDYEDAPVENTNEITFGKIAIENIPRNVAKEDILSILMGYGEMKSFSLKPSGKFLKAFVEMNIEGDIDWIVECLNGSELFGASSEILKCYKITKSCD